MALIHSYAALSPTKAALLAAWVPRRPWGVADFSLAGAYRFDDPAGEVGIETHLLRTGEGRVLQVPLTYRGAPLPGVPEITTMEHTVLGKRWVYDGCADPVAVAAFAAAVVAGLPQAELWADGVRHEPSVRVRGSGRPGAEVPAIAAEPVDSAGATVVGGRLVVHRVVGGPAAEAAVPGLVWVSDEGPRLLAHLVPGSASG